MRAKLQSPALKTATCAALIAASIAIGQDARASSSSIDSIERYCRTSWKQAGIPQQEWEDCTQETLAELLSRLPEKQLSSAIDEPKSQGRRELMRSVWCVLQRWRRATKKQTVSLHEIYDGVQVEGDGPRALAQSEFLNKGLQRLSDMQREILKLWSHGNTVAEIADRLRVPPARVSDQKYKALRNLRSQLVTG